MAKKYKEGKLRRQGTQLRGASPGIRKVGKRDINEAIVSRELHRTGSRVRAADRATAARVAPRARPGLRGRY
jgi:hypothetical protein